MVVWSHDLRHNIVEMGASGMGELLHFMLDKNQRDRKTARKQGQVTPKVPLFPQ